MPLFLEPQQLFSWCFSVNLWSFFKIQMANNSSLILYFSRNRGFFKTFFFIPTTLALLSTFFILFYISTTSHLFFNHHQRHHQHKLTPFILKNNPLPPPLKSSPVLVSLLNVSNNSHGDGRVRNQRSVNVPMEANGMWFFGFLFMGMHALWNCVMMFWCKASVFICLEILLDLNFDVI